MPSFILRSAGHSRHTTAMETSSMPLALDLALFRSISLRHWSPPSRAKQEAFLQYLT